jgi:hypothetical protein
LPVLPSPLNFSTAAFAVSKIAFNLVFNRVLILRLSGEDDWLSYGVSMTMLFNGLRVSRVAGVEDSCAGKARWKYPNLRWGAAVATSAARPC